MCRCNECLANTKEHILSVSEAVAGHQSFSYTAIINTLYAILAFLDFILYTSSLRRYYYTYLAFEYNCTTPVHPSPLGCAEGMHRHPCDSVFIHSNTRTLGDRGLSLSILLSVARNL